MRFNTVIEVSPKTVRQMWQKLDSKTGAVQSYCQHAEASQQHLKFCDDFSDFILTGKCSVKIECYPCRSFRIVGEQRRIRNV